MRNRIALLVSAMLLVGLLVGLTTSASAGAGDPGATAAKKKKKVCPAGTHKVVVKKKNGKKKKTCVPDTTAAPVTPPTPTTPAPPTTLAINPTNFAYDPKSHGNCSAPPDDTDCQVQTFTVTNTGGNPSGVPVTTIVETSNPGPDTPGFITDTNSCVAALPPAGTCTVSVYFKHNSEGAYAAVLHVTATPGSDAQATLSGTGLG